MRLIYLFIICFLTFGCGLLPKKNKVEPAPMGPKFDAVKAKREKYCELSKAAYDAKGYTVGECDGLLFTSLHRVACGDYFKIDSFQDPEKPGRWNRNPKRDCFERGTADSTISKDMMIGLMIALLQYKDKKNVQALASYGNDHTWFMGDAKDTVTKVSKTLLTPTLIKTLKLIDKAIPDALKFGGIDIPDLGDDEKIGINDGFRAHLDVIHILLRGKLEGGINDYDKYVLSEQAKRVPRNALFNAAASRYGAADANGGLDMLLNESFFPSDKLPTSKDNYCADYLFQRDDSPDNYAPCAADDVKSGTDYVFTAAVFEQVF